MKTVTFTPTEELMATPESERIAWAEALESGEYKQANGQLTKEGGFCCLGVFEAMRGRSADDFVDEDGDFFEYPSECQFRPSTLGGRLPESINTAEIVRGNSQTMYSNPLFSELNDVHGFTFPEIAMILRGQTVTKEIEE